MIKIATAQLWVHDQDEALAFYTQKLGMEVRSDVTLAEMGDFRWLTVGPAGQDDVAIVLMAIPGPPVMDADAAEQVREPDGQGLRRHGVPDHGRLPGGLRGAQGPRRRVHRGPRGAPLRDRRGFRDPSGNASGSPRSASWPQSEASRRRYRSARRSSPSRTWTGIGSRSSKE